MYSFFPAKTFRQRATKRSVRKVIFRAPRFFQYLLDQVELLNRVHSRFESQVGHSNVLNGWSLNTMMRYDVMSRYMDIQAFWLAKYPDTKKVEICNHPSIQLSKRVDISKYPWISGYWWIIKVSFWWDITPILNGLYSWTKQEQTIGNILFVQKMR